MIGKLCSVLDHAFSHPRLTSIACLHCSFDGSSFGWESFIVVMALPRVIIFSHRQVDEQVILSPIGAQFCRHGIRSYGRGMNVTSPAATWHADWQGRRQSSRDQAPSLARSSFLSCVIIWLCTAARVVRQTRRCRCVGPFDSYRLPAPARTGVALFKPRVFWLPSL